MIAIMFAKYSVTGSVSISVGLVTAIILRNINRLKESYEPEESMPRWFTFSMVALLLFGTLIGMLCCKMLADYAYQISEGAVTPWSLFGLVAAITTLVFVYAFIMYKGSRGSKRRLYIFLMVLSATFFLSQCTGSLSSSKKIEHEEWIKSME